MERVDSVTRQGPALLDSIDWDFADTNQREPIHELHPYPAKFIAQIPRELIRLYHPGDSSPVLDPFCGCGTSLVEAARVGLPSVGVDSHPLAILISKVKTTPLTAPLYQIARRVVQESRWKLTPIPPIPRLDHWFQPRVQQELANLVSGINAVPDRATQDCLKLALSRIIIRVSNQESDTRYAAVQKTVPDGQVYKYFLESSAVVERVLYRTYGGLLSPQPVCKLINRNILEVEPETIGNGIGLVITSPPYPNAYEYWLYHKYRMYWLGMDPIAVKAAEIGARAHFFKSNPATEADFELQMKRVFALLSSVMKPTSFACFLVGRSVIRGRTIDNVAILERAASSTGFAKVGDKARRIPRTRKSFNPAVSTIVAESIVVFQLGAAR